MNKKQVLFWSIVILITLLLLFNWKILDLSYGLAGKCDKTYTNESNCNCFTQKEQKLKFWNNSVPLNIENPYP